MKPDRALAAAMAGDDSQAPSADRLEKIREELRKARDWELELSEIAARSGELSAKLLEMKNKTLVDMFDEAKIKNLGLLPEGNKPAYDIEIKPYYKANISDEWEPERKAAGYTYLEKQGEGDMLRNTYTIAFGKGTRKAQKALEGYLKKAKIEYSNKVGVPWNTLTSWLKDQIENHEKTPDLDLIGATVGRVASVVKPKKERK